MHNSKARFDHVKKKYLKFLKSQEVVSEPFRDKLGQLNKCFLPISKKIHRIYLDNNKTKIIGLTGGQGSGKSTIANELEKKLYKNKYLSYLLDGDNIRVGLNKDLGFSWSL